MRIKRKVLHLPQGHLPQARRSLRTPIPDQSSRTRGITLMPVLEPS